MSAEKNPGESLEKAKKRFHASIVMLVLALIYLISPVDLIPGPPPFEWIEDIPILISALIFNAYSYWKLRKERERSSGSGTGETA